MWISGDLTFPVTRLIRTYDGFLEDNRSRCEAVGRIESSSDTRKRNDAPISNRRAHGCAFIHRSIASAREHSFSRHTLFTRSATLWNKLGPVCRRAAFSRVFN